MNRDLVRLRVDALRSLGVASVARVGVYRALVRLGYYRWRQPVRPALVGPFLSRPARDDRVWPNGSSGEAWSADARSVLAGEIPAFSSGGVRSSFPPRWNHSLLAPDAAPAPGGHWTQLSDFGLPGGDIKGYWESARFDGFIAVALGWLATGEPDCADGLERWLSSFASACPANAGVQWRCGQETSIRLMHTLAVLEILRDRGGWGHTDALVEMVVQRHQRDFIFQ